MNSEVISRFGIIRHAPTLWNEEKRIQGQQDSPLSSRGKIMAEKWGEKLKELSWDRLLCSDLERVHKTVRLVNKSMHLPVEEDSRLREQDWGSWTGMTLAAIKQQDLDLLRQQEQKGWDFRAPGGESRREVLERILAALTDAHTVWPGEQILVVCHEGIIKSLLYHLLGRKFLPDEPKVIKGYSLHLLCMENKELSLDKMNFLALPIINHKNPSQ